MICLQPLGGGDIPLDDPAAQFVRKDTLFR